eukprot:3012680-Alexandrium_andersonii.AAC.1
MDDALDPYPLAQLRHIPGVSNEVADALSRQFAPEANAFPMVLVSVQRSIAPAREVKYCQCLQPRIAKAAYTRTPAARTRAPMSGGQM